MWVEYKKRHLQEMFIPFISEDQTEAVYSKIGKSYDLTRSDLLEGQFENRFQEYLEAMAKLEEEEGSLESALARAISEGLDHRAKIDHFSLEMLREIGVRIELIMGDKLYNAVLDEVNVLSSIMDSKGPENEIKDKGKRELDYVFQKRLGDFS